jgi:hypothetical protein
LSEALLLLLLLLVVVVMVVLLSLLPFLLRFRISGPHASPIAHADDSS